MSFWSWFARWFKHKPAAETGGAPMILVPAKPGKALLVGINTYPGAPLAGCVNDARNLEALLLTRYNFEPKNIKLLLDADATTANIREALKWLCSEVMLGQAVLLGNSCHGAQTPTSDPGEPDGLAEVLCPVDFDWSPEKMLTDKQLVGILSGMPEGVRFNWLSDSCHSGDLDREIPKPKRRAKQMPCPEAMAQRIHGLRRRGTLAKGLRARVGGQLDVGFVSGCQSDQTSADTEVDGQACGAFTHYFLEALRHYPDDVTLAQVAQDTRRRLSQEGYPQSPQAEGPQASKPFLR